MARYRPLEERFWEKVLKGPECWAWLGSHQARGYGMIRLPRHGSWIHAHRVAYELTNGPISSSELFVCHKCDNPGCVRPDHLFLGTAKDNARDMIVKGRGKGHRYKGGEEHEMAKLTWSQVFEVRRFYRTGNYSLKQLGAQFDVTERAIDKIVRYETWREGIAG